jgi:hypothetical protein
MEARSLFARVSTIHRWSLPLNVRRVLPRLTDRAEVRLQRTSRSIGNRGSKRSDRNHLRAEGLLKRPSGAIRIGKNEVQKCGGADLSYGPRRTDSSVDQRPAAKRLN